MLQYAWLNKDVTNEIKAYNNLAITYFNLSDLKNSKYYHERGFNMLLEPEDSRTRQLACRELTQIQNDVEQSRLIGIYKTTEIDFTGKPHKKLHRTNTVY